MKQKPTEAQPETPTLKRRFSDSPEHVLLLKQLAEVQAKRTELDQEVQRLGALQANQRRPFKAVSHAARLLMIKLGLAAESEATLSTQDIQEMVANALQDRKACDEVISALRVKREALETDLSREICLARADEHKRIALRICNAYIALAEANKAEQAWFSDLADDGVRIGGYFEPMAVPGVGDLTDRESNVRRHLRAAWSYGVAIPEQHITDPPIERGPAIKVRLLTSLAGPDGYYPVGSIIKSDLAQHLVKTRAAVLADPGAPLTKIARAPENGQWGWTNNLDDSSWTPAT